MKTRLALIPLVALATVGLGAGIGQPTSAPRAPVAAAAPLVTATALVAAAPEADAAPVARRLPLKVLPTMTVVPSRDEILAAHGRADDDSLMLGAAVEQAAAAVVKPVGAALPRARLGNPFYDFARLRPAAVE